MRLGITAALTDLDVAPAVVAAMAEELGFDSFWVPEHTHLPVREDIPPALVEGVRLDDYKRCLDPLVASATAAAPPPASVSAPASCSPHSTTRSCWPSRSPRSTTCQTAA